MILLVTLGLLTFVGSLIWIFSDEWGSINFVGSVVALIFGSSLVLALILLPINYYSTKVEVDRYHILKETIEESRSSNISEIERAALIQEIVNYNKKLASIKFWNNTIFDIYIYDGLAELDYLK